MKQQDTEETTQKECAVQFISSHRASISKSLLEKKLRYLSDEDIVESIMEGTCGIPA
jgi:hypothetical protein